MDAKFIMQANSVQAVPRLYISDITVPQSTELMRQYRFTHVVSLTNARHRPQIDGIEGIEQLWVDIQDEPFEDILICLEGICTWIEDALEKDLGAESRPKLKLMSQTRGDDQNDDEGTRDTEDPNPGETRVLIHCIQGISRSGAVLVAYLMRSQQLSYESALKIAQNARTIVAPNSGFADQIRIWQQLQYSIHNWGETTVEVSLKDEYLEWKSNRGVLLSRSQQDQQKSLLQKMENIIMNSRARGAHGHS
ncbi:phosphatases II [Periconia macrospinosa]|uniref:protein-tyrosine-phosphatase n=1 Tax=Periconia macrospinosa TaxID=97972 RepID=A0A2V1D419_9PLEO|nr:phosphatases II [Periconia macrospinosa]